MPTEPTSSTGQAYPTVLGYQIVQLLGGGGFSRVFRAVNPNAKQYQQAAVKVVSYAPSRHRQPVDRRALQKEVQIHSILKHPNVLAFLGSVEYTQSTPAPSNYVRGLYILLELGAGGDLFDKIAPDVGVDEDLAHFYFTQLIAGLVYIHAQGVTHRDIKPENMLLDAQGNLKIADFGLCSVYRYKGKERVLHGTCGSLPYIAPEMNGLPYQGEPVDVWSSGVVLYALLAGNTPWDEPTGRSPEYVAYRSGAIFHMDPWTRFSGDALSLLRRMMYPDPKRRATLEQVQRHRWFTRPNPLLSAGRCTDPVGLAERLLQGLVVSGDMHIALHTDGKRAAVPESLSLSQPEAMRAGAPGLDTGVPSSTAQPALGARVRRAAASQATRPDDFGTQGDGEFTQALSYLTQSAAPRPAAGIALQLTRFFSAADSANVARAVAAALDAHKAQYGAEPMGDDLEANDLLGALDEAPAASSHAITSGSRGVRLRVGLTDRRKCALRGEIRVERIHALPPDVEPGRGTPAGDGSASFVLMRRSKGNPLEWRRLFRAICMHPGVHPLIAAPPS